MRVNFVFQDDRGRYTDKLAKVEIVDTEQRKLVKDALDILHQRRVPSRTWGVDRVHVRYSINKSDLLNTDGPNFELFEDDLLHCTLCPNGDDYIVVTQQEKRNSEIPKEEQLPASKNCQDSAIENIDQKIIQPCVEIEERSAHSKKSSDSISVEGVEEMSAPLTAAGEQISIAVGSDHLLSWKESEYPDKAKVTKAHAGEERSFAVGSDHFLFSTGLEYPVKVKAVKPRSGKFEVKFVGYRTTRVLCKEELLEFTPTRQHTFEEALKKTKELDQQGTVCKFKKRTTYKQKQNQAWQKRDRKTLFIYPSENKVKTDPVTHIWPSIFGPCTNVDDLPLVHKDDTSSTSKCIEQIEKKRRIYYAENDETPKMIADHFRMDVNQILYDNRQRSGYDRVKAWSKLKVNSPIVLPLP